MKLKKAMLLFMAATMAAGTVAGCSGGAKETTATSAAKRQVKDQRRSFTIRRNKGRGNCC